MILITISLANNGIIKTIEDTNTDTGEMYVETNVYELESSKKFITDVIEDVGIPLNEMKFVLNENMSYEQLLGEYERHSEYLKELKKEMKKFEKSIQQK